MSKKRYFYGIKVHLLVTATGEPIEFFFTPGRVGDVEGLWIYPFDLPTDSVVYADKAYNDYRISDALAEAGIELKPIRFSSISYLQESVGIRIDEKCKIVKTQTNSFNTRA